MHRHVIIALPLMLQGLWMMPLVVGAEPSTADNPPTRPNIVIIMTDDLDVDSLKTMVNRSQMPHLKQYLIDQGQAFTNAFVTNSVCCPSRATFLTGQYTHNHGVLSNDPSNGGVTKLDDHSTIATWLDEAGYRTSHVGKYLNGYGYQDLTGDHEVDEEDITYVPPGWDDWQALSDADYLSTYRVYNYWIIDNGQPVHHGTAREDYQTDVLAQRAKRFILESEDKDDDAPFFLIVMPLAPHVEFIPGVTAFEPYAEIWKMTIRPAPRHRRSVWLPVPWKLSFNEWDVSDKPLWLQQRPRIDGTDYYFLTRQYRQRLESLRAVDDLIGTIVETLEGTGELERTVLVFTSDNGFLYGEHKLPEKLYAYEEAIAVPLYIRDFRVPVSSTRTIDRVVINTDLAPTIADLAGVTPPLEHLVDGTSLVPLLKDPTISEWRKRFLIEHWRGNDSDLEVPTYAAVRSKWDSPLGSVNLLFVEYEDPLQTPEFYDLNFDPLQMESRHDSPSRFRIRQRKALHGVLLRMKDCAGESCHDLEF